MARVRSIDTTPEMHMRRELHRRGLRYRLHDRQLPGRPDMVFARARVAVFVDGDFWHGNQWKLRGLSGLAAQFHSNEAYWTRKIASNVKRDEHVRECLAKMGWTVLSVWESDVMSNLQVCADRVEKAVRGRRGSCHEGGE